MDPVIVHQIAGAALVVIALLLLARALGWIRGDWPVYVLPASLLLLGLFLLLDPIVFHGGTFGAEGTQHQIQGAVLIVVAAVELGRARRRLPHRAWGALLPIAVGAVGVMFMLHSQHGGGDMLLQITQHRILGATLILTALVLAIDNLGLARGNWAAIGWPLLVLALSLQLFLYVEGGTPSADRGQGPATPVERGHEGH
ncbi:MAG: hypothetical protein IT385_28770 [Deltaproteobacteria bacterium]|nr:hypothetical protein [Deltaproteobacteria bacterium]